MLLHLDWSSALSQGIGYFQRSRIYITSSTEVNEPSDPIAIHYPNFLTVVLEITIWLVNLETTCLLEHFWSFDGDWRHQWLSHPHFSGHAIKQSKTEKKTSWRVANICMSQPADNPAGMRPAYGAGFGIRPVCWIRLESFCRAAWAARDAIPPPSVPERQKDDAKSRGIRCLARLVFRCRFLCQAKTCWYLTFVYECGCCKLND